MPRILLADDDPRMRRVLTSLLTLEGFEVVGAADGAEALALFGQQTFDIVLTDLDMPKVDGIGVLQAVVRRTPGVPVVMVTAAGSLRECVRAVRAGATNFLGKPFHQTELLDVVREALRTREITTSTSSVRSNRSEATVGLLLGESSALRDVFALVQRVAATDATALLGGETGTGKEVIARLIHGLSARAGAPLVTINCGAIPENLLESELFGHVRGAFTGATDRRIGTFALAHQGTLFLDEVGELSLSAQVKLLRAIQEREITPVGDGRAQKVDVRIVAATHRDLEEMVAKGTFRSDLYYRLNVVTIPIPPLRQRREDIPLLIEHFTQRFAQSLQRQMTWESDAMEYLTSYAWPGNVRELENLVERLVITCTSERISAHDLPGRYRGLVADPVPEARARLASSEPLPDTLRTIERHLIEDALAKAGGNKKKAAELLGINRTTLIEKLKRIVG